MLFILFCQRVIQLTLATAYSPSTLPFCFLSEENKKGLSRFDRLLFDIGKQAGPRAVIP